MPYYYLISTLPILALGEKPPATSEEFMNTCSDWVSKSKYKELDKLSLTPNPDIKFNNKAVTGWNNWETCLRNRIAKARSANIDKDAAKYIQYEKDSFSEMDRGIQEAFGANDPKQKERVLDDMRWKQLDFLESGHTFDFGKLCIYKLRLMLCEKWLDREYEKGQAELDKTLDIFYSSTKEKGKEAMEGKEEH